MENYFCIIGAQRSGTTYLYNILDSHPQIKMAKPLKPEPKYFLNEDKYNKGKNFYLDSYFSNITEDIKIIGEKSTSYIEHDLSEKIKSIFSKAKILAILRNPVDRAISNYFFSYNNGFENRTLSEVFLEKKPPPKFDKQEVSVSPFEYLERGLYSKHLKSYLEAFEENIKIIIFEDFIGKVEEVRKVLSFLGVSVDVKINCISESFNSGNYGETRNLKEVKTYLNVFYQEEIEKMEKLKNRKILQWRQK